jgi:uncharacterized DUF497 family protein
MCHTLMYSDITFEWDEAKNQSNQRKHGVSFETAVLVFEDPNMEITFDRFDPETGEPRWHARGLAAGRVLLVVVHVYRKDQSAQNIIRIISARKSGSRDRRRRIR